MRCKYVDTTTGRRPKTARHTNTTVCAPVSAVGRTVLCAARVRGGPRPPVYARAAPSAHAVEAEAPVDERARSSLAAALAGGEPAVDGRRRARKGRVVARVEAARAAVVAARTGGGRRVR